MNEDLVRAKNRLHKVLQVTFPELENLLSTPTGEQYWNLMNYLLKTLIFLKLERLELG